MTNQQNEFSKANAKQRNQKNAFKQQQQDTEFATEQNATDQFNQDRKLYGENAPKD